MKPFLRMMIIPVESAILLLLAALAITAHGQPRRRHHVKHHTPVNQCTITGAIKECAPGGVR